MSITAKDVQLPKDHPFYKVIVYDGYEGKYYHKTSDIYLTDDDISAYKLPDPSTLEGYKEPIDKHHNG